MSAELWWRVEGARREWLRGREQRVQSGEARVRYRALGELRGEAEVGGGGRLHGAGLQAVAWNLVFILLGAQGSRPSGFLWWKYFVISCPSCPLLLPLFADPPSLLLPQGSLWFPSATQWHTDK